MNRDDDILDATRWSIAEAADKNISRLEYSPDEGKTWQPISASVSMIEGVTTEVPSTDAVTTVMQNAVDKISASLKEFAVTIAFNAKEFQRLLQILSSPMPARKRHYLRRMARRSGIPWEHIK